MRAALLLVTLALPALARAQAAGVVQPVPGEDRYATDAYLNAAECDATQNRTLELRWTVTGGSVASGVFRIWAMNKAPPAAGTNGVVVCPTLDDTQTTLFTGMVGPDINTGITGATGTGTVSAAEIVTEAGYACTADTEQTIHLCVNFHPFRGTGTQDVDPTPAAHAIGTLTFSTRKPATPTLNSVAPGDGRLYAHFSDGSGGAVGTDRYLITATPVAPSTLPARSRDVDASGDYVAGLQNDQAYTVTVQALSVAGNASDASNGIVGTPLPGDDFWDRYRAAGGVEEGGCAAGAAGPLALSGLAAALALARTRARARARRRS